MLPPEADTDDRIPPHEAFNDFPCGGYHSQRSIGLLGRERQGHPDIGVHPQAANSPPTRFPMQYVVIVLPLGATNLTAYQPYE
jgi:hypothetical protein